ncbi:MAG: 1,4-alpha-glucan branching protein domain-containing protein [Ignavibacteria bacterium]
MITFVLHTHLPYVLHHGHWPHGSDWLCEAVAECYIPLIRMCRRLVDDGIRPGITFDISPILCEQLSHPDFAPLFSDYCKNHITLARADRDQFLADKAEQSIINQAEYWMQWYEDALHAFQTEFDGKILPALRALQDEGAIEIMTCGATHGFFPLLAEDASIELQVDLAVRSYTKHFGKPPRGIWLPECAYRPAYPWRTYLPVYSYSRERHRQGIEQILQRWGIEYFITDEGALRDSEPIGVRGDDGYRTPYHETYGECRQQLETRTPYHVYNVSGHGHHDRVSVLTRHMNIALQVWSGQTGYPGDPDYLDFHKKYHSSALRYWRVTDSKADMQYKQVYMPAWAQSRTASHARHFVDILEATVTARLAKTGHEPTICLPFDTELFGHWWFEGPMFIEQVLRGIHASNVLRVRTASEQIDHTHPTCEIALPESSWGKDGNDSVWMNDETKWTWEAEYALERRVQLLLEKHPIRIWDHIMKRIGRNVLGELLLVQSSDWQFLITNWTGRDYAEMRFHNHVHDLRRCCEIFERYAVTRVLTHEDIEYIDELEQRDGVFTEELNLYFADHAV